MSKVYTDIFTVTYAIGNRCICTSQNDMGGENETIVHRGFLFAHKIFLGNKFVSEVDYGGQVVLETIRKL